MQKNAKSGNERQYARAEAIAMLGDEMRKLERELKKFDGVKEVRRCYRLGRAAENHYHEMQRQHPMNELGTAGRVLVGIFSLGTSEIAGAASAAGAVNQACAQLDRAKNDLREARQRYDVWTDNLDPSSEELGLERRLAAVKDKYEELQRVRAEYVTMDFSNFTGQFNYEVGAVNNGGLKFN